MSLWPIARAGLMATMRSPSTESGTSRRRASTRYAAACRPRSRSTVRVLTRHC